MDPGEIEGDIQVTLIGLKFKEASSGKGGFRAPWVVNTVRLLGPKARISIGWHGSPSHRSEFGLEVGSQPGMCEKAEKKPSRRTGSP